MSKKVTSVIGLNPIINGFIVLGIFGALFYGAYLLDFKIGELFAGLLILWALYNLLLAFPRMIVYNNAKKAILSGQIDPDFAIHFIHNGIIMVDEDSRKIFVNYLPVLDFDDIRRVEWVDGNIHGVIKVITKSGRNPIREVDCDPEKAGENQFHRLTNVLGF